MKLEVTGVTTAAGDLYGRDDLKTHSLLDFPLNDLLVLTVPSFVPFHRVDLVLFLCPDCDPVSSNKLLTTLT